MRATEPAVRLVQQLEKTITPVLDDADRARERGAFASYEVLPEFFVHSHRSFTTERTENTELSVQSACIDSVKFKI